jgi:hypothetical protein
MNTQEKIKEQEILNKVISKFDNASQMTITNKIEMEFMLKEAISLTLKSCEEEQKEKVEDLKKIFAGRIQIRWQTIFKELDEIFNSKNAGDRK